MDGGPEIDDLVADEKVLSGSPPFYDNAVIEPFWARMQVELLNRQSWRARVELANAIFGYIEGFHNRSEGRAFAAR